MKEFIDALISGLKVVHSNWNYILVFYIFIIGMPLTVIFTEIIIPIIRRKIENGINTRNKKH